MKSGIARKTVTRILVVASFFTPVLIAEDLSVPLDNGHIGIQAQFIRVTYGSSIPELTVKLKNQTSSPWRTIKLEFDIGGLCNGEPRQWTIPVSTSLGWSPDFELVKDYVDVSIPLMGKVDGCKTEIIKARLLLAENSNIRINGETGERVDLAAQLREIEEKQKATQAAKEEQDRIAREAEAKQAEEDAKKQAAEQAAEDARQKRLAAEQKRKQAEADAQLAKLKAQEDAAKAEELRRTAAACKLVYKNTIDKKINDLTVREDGQVQACRALGLYAP